MGRVAGNGWRHLSNPAKLLDGILYRPIATACGTVGWKLPESYTAIPPEFTLGNWMKLDIGGRVGKIHRAVDTWVDRIQKDHRCDWCVTV